MTQPSIKRKLENSKGFVQGRMNGHLWWAGRLGIAQTLAVGLAVLLALITGGGGKAITDPLGAAIGSDPSTAWRAICVGVAIFSVAGWVLGKFATEQKVR